MKTKYNKIIEWVIMIILLIPAITLIALTYMLKVAVTLVKVLQVTVEISIAAVRALKEKLVEVLSIKD